ncbi:hypothetical protein J9303_20825 [Bacillaceae bacterium Marseille-Q3522]|nr:hypothetical protein [Bacillaceae bacterium Marseille-Q3522]
MSLKTRKLLFIGLAILVLIFALYWWNKPAIDSMENEQESNKLLSVKEMHEDLDYLAKVLSEVHPATRNGWTEEQQKVIDQVYERIDSPLTIDQFYFFANEIITLLQDGHTAMLTRNLFPTGKTLNFPVFWLRDGLYVMENTKVLRKGDRIVSVGGKPLEEIYDGLKAIIPAENSYAVKYLGSIQLQTFPVLSHLGLLKDDSVSVEVERNGTVITANISINDKRKISFPYSPYIKSDRFVSYTMDPEHSLAVFTLNECNYNEEYKTILKQFFLKVAQNNIDHIVIDLRSNTGGNNGVINEFLQYLDVDQYMGYGTEVRFSTYVKKTRKEYSNDSGYHSSPSTIERNKKVSDPNLLFKGNIFVLTSPATFSAATDWAVLFKDNQIGKIVGEPTGNAPTFYADTLPFQLPDSGIKFTVSFKKFIRPYPENDPEDALYPDIPVYTTIEDIIQGRDPQMEKVKELVSGESNE